MDDGRRYTARPIYYSPMIDDHSIVPNIKPNHMGVAITQILVTNKIMTDYYTM